MTDSDPTSSLKLPTDTPLSIGVGPMGINEQPLSCNVSSEDVYRVIDGYFDGVDSTHKQDLSRHLDGCDCCSDVFRFQLRLRSVIGARCREELPADVRRRVLDSISKLT